LAPWGYAKESAEPFAPFVGFVVKPSLAAAARVLTRTPPFQSPQPTAIDMELSRKFAYRPIAPRRNR